LPPAHQMRCIQYSEWEVNSAGDLDVTAEVRKPTRIIR
jgi:hypothetical protein